MKNGENICLDVYNKNIEVKSFIKYKKYDVNELDKNRILCQIQKTGNTIFHIKKANIEVEDLKIPVKELNHLRKDALEKFEKALENSIKRNYYKKIDLNFEYPISKKHQKPKINLFLQKFSEKIHYSKLDYHQIYVPFKDLIKKPKIRNCIAVLPTILDEKYEKLIFEYSSIFENVEGVAISHISQIELLEKLNIQKKIMADYGLNITNSLSEKVIKDMGVQRLTISPELDKNAIQYTTQDLEKELVVYGRTCLMTSKYCPIGKNKNCQKACQQGTYTLKDRMNCVFPILSDDINCYSKIYNSKILSIDATDLEIDFIRMDVMNETEEDIEQIIKEIKRGKRFSGKNYTGGNF